MQGWEEQGPRAVSFHGHAEVTRNRGLEWDNWWVGREVVDQRGLEEPKQAWGQGQKFAPMSTSVCPLCMGQHAGPHTQGPSSASTGAWMEVTRWTGPPAADEGVKPGTGFPVTSVGSGPLQRPPDPHTVGGER